MIPCRWCGRWFAGKTGNAAVDPTHCPECRAAGKASSLTDGAQLENKIKRFPQDVEDFLCAVANEPRFSQMRWYAYRTVTHGVRWGQ